jgi:hypothetical protein
MMPPKHLIKLCSIEFYHTGPDDFSLAKRRILYNATTTQGREKGVMQKYFFNGLLLVVAAPLIFGQWLFCGKAFGPCKVIIFVVTMFLFGSAFFFD